MGARPPYMSPDPKDFDPNGPRDAFLAAVVLVAFVALVVILGVSAALWGPGW